MRAATITGVRRVAFKRACAAAWGLPDPSSGAAVTAASSGALKAPSLGVPGRVGGVNARASLPKPRAVGESSRTIKRFVCWRLFFSILICFL